MKGYACFLFLNPQGEVGPSISSSVVLCSFVLLVYIVVLVLVFCLCPSSVRVVTIFSRTVLFPLLCSVPPFFFLIHWFFSSSSFVIPGKCLKNFICVASKRCSSLFFSTQASVPNFNAVLAFIPFKVSSSLHNHHLNKCWIHKICQTHITLKVLITTMLAAVKTLENASHTIPVRVYDLHTKYRMYSPASSSASNFRPRHTPNSA